MCRCLYVQKQYHIHIMFNHNHLHSISVQTEVEFPVPFSPCSNACAPSQSSVQVRPRLRFDFPGMSVFELLTVASLPPQQPATNTELIIISPPSGPKDIHYMNSRNIIQKLSLMQLLNLRLKTHQKSITMNGVKISVHAFLLHIIS